MALFGGTKFKDASSGRTKISYGSSPSSDAMSWKTSSGGGRGSVGGGVRMSSISNPYARGGGSSSFSYKKPAGNINPILAARADINTQRAADTAAQDVQSQIDRTLEAGRLRDASMGISPRSNPGKEAIMAAAKAGAMNRARTDAEQMSFDRLARVEQLKLQARGQEASEQSEQFGQSMAAQRMDLARQGQEFSQGMERDQFESELSRWAGIPSGAAKESMPTAEGATQAITPSPVDSIYSRNVSKQMATAAKQQRAATPKPKWGSLPGKQMPASTRTFKYIA